MNSTNDMPFIHAVPALMDVAGLSVWEMEPGGKTVSLSPLLQKKTGLPASMAFVDFRNALVAEEDKEKVSEGLAKCMEGDITGCNAIFRFHKTVEQTVWLREHVVILPTGNDNNPPRLAGLIQDVTVDALTHEALRAENTWRERLSRMAGLGGWEWDVAKNWMSFSDDYKAVLGHESCSMDGPLEEVCARFMHPEDSDRAQRRIRHYADNPHGTYFNELRMKHADGRYIWLQDTGIATERDATGKAVRIVCGALNVDARVRAEVKLRDMVREMAGYTEKLESTVEKTRSTHASMFDTNPHVMLLFDGNAQPIECNPAAVDVFGFVSKQELLQEFSTRMGEWTSRKSPDKRSPHPFAENFRITMERGYHACETELAIQGEHTAFDVICKRVVYEGSYAVLMYLTDLSRIRKTQESLDEQNRLMRILHSVVTSLMGSSPENFEARIHMALALAGDALDVDRVRIWRNFEREGELWSGEIYGWSRVEKTYAHYSREMQFSAFPYWRKTLLERNVLNAYTALLPAAEKHFLQSQEILSILVVPIYVRDSFWGLIGLEDCTNQRSFSKTEERFLQSTGNFIVSATLRNEMTQNLIKAREEALSSARAKSDFLSRMSHEIRTPMNAIIGMAALAKKSGDMAKIEECLVKIDSSSKQLLGIINDVLDMSKIEADKFEIHAHPFDFEKMLQNVLNVMQVKIDEKRQVFRFDFDRIFTRRIVNDELRLSQVLLNLLSNAVKFTPECGTIVMKVREKETDERACILQISVTDSGIGIPEDRQDKLFQSFEQADGTITRQFGGTGLGLAISKKIINLMGGDIWVESQPGKGTTFIFEVPASWGEPLAASRTPLQLCKGKRALIVDDDPEILEYLSSILKGFAMEVATASDGEQAIEMVAQSLAEGKPYAMAFVDWFMPGRNGGETVQAIRGILGEKALIIMISSADRGDLALDAEKYGLFRFMQKPILPSTLCDVLAQSIEQALEADPVSDAPTKVEWKGKHILLVEDIEINREIVMGLLEDTGVTVTTASDGQEAVDLFALYPDRFDIILMDVQMPVLDGISATRAIRSLPHATARTIPIIAMTANAFKEDERDCLEAGMNAHIAKPIEMDVIYSVVGSFLS